MASSLELAKLIVAGFLYNYWSKINKILRIYLLLGTAVLVLITSAGIYGFLTSAYQTTSDELGIIDKQTEIIELKKNRYEEQLSGHSTEKIQLNQSISELSKGLSNNVIQYKDKETGEIITTTSSNTRRVLENQLNDFKSQRDILTIKEDLSRDSITSLDLQILDLKINNDVAAEIGPLRYISKITGKEMDTVVNWFALFIVFVFDPLAVTLIVAFSIALKVDKGEKDKKTIMENNYQIYGDSGKNSTETDKNDDIMENIPPQYTKQEKKHQREALEKMMQLDEEAGLYDDNLDIPNYDSYNDYHDEVVENSETGSITISENDAKIFTDTLKNPPEPNEHLKEAFKKYMKEDELGEPGISNSNWIEYDQRGGWKNPYKSSEYFYHPWFDWKKPTRWIYNQNAVKFWLHYKAGTYAELQKYIDMYPNSDNTKLY